MKKRQVFYIHGGGSYSDYEAYLHDLETMTPRDLPNREVRQKWTKTLAADLGDAFEVFMPEMPNKWNARYEEWKRWFERHFEFLEDGVILIGNSLGAYFLAKYLSENAPDLRIDALFLMAAPFHNFSSGQSREDGGDFQFDPERLPDIAKRVERIYILHSKDDFIVPYEHALSYAQALPEARLMTFQDRNHFLVEEMPELLAEIRALAQ